MPFNSINYYIFLLLVVAIFIQLKSKYRWPFLLLSSYVFYSYWNIWFLAVLITITLVLYLCAYVVDRVRYHIWAKNICFFSGLMFVIGVLFVFKYLNARDFAFNIYELSVDKLVLPLGLSFYSFQGLSYLIDVYRGQIKTEKNIGIFALYMAFFPQLVCGPIEMVSQLIPQFRRPDFQLSWKDLEVSCLYIALGLFKKMVLADTVFIFVNSVFSNPILFAGLPFILASFFGSYHLFLDFSGYTDIAMGSAKLFGVNLTQNFKQPFLAISPTDFWRRFHRTMVMWFSHYVFLPLSRRFSSLRGIRFSLIVTFLLVGVWHVGDVWHIVWGGLHGLIYLAENVFSKTLQRLSSLLRLKRAPRCHQVIRIIITQLIIMIPLGFVQFGRSVQTHTFKDLSAAFITQWPNWRALEHFFIHKIPVIHMLIILMLIIVLEFLQSYNKKKCLITWFQRQHVFVKVMLFLIWAFFIIVLGNHNGSIFVYYRY